MTHVRNPHRAAAGEATYQLQCMEAIIKTLELLDCAQRQLPLFPVP